MPKALLRVLSLFLFVAATAAAQNNRSFVSTSGSDLNDCSAGHECRSFTRALSVTNAGGEVLALTSGGYGPFTVSQAVSVVATTGAASITASDGSIAVTVNAFNSRVVLRGLNITVAGPNGNGIFASSYSSLSIENCSINGSAVGVLIAGGSVATVQDTTVRQASVIGFAIQSNAVLIRCRAEKSGTGAGLDVAANSAIPVDVTLTEFVSSGNQNGVRAFDSTSGHVIVVVIDRSMLVNNANDGVFCNGTSGANVIIYIGNSVSAHNLQYGLNASTGGTIFSLKNNIVGNNAGGAINGNITALAGQ